MGIGMKIKANVTLARRLSTRMVLRRELQELEQRVQQLDKEILSTVGDEGYDDDRWNVKAIDGVSGARVSKELLVKYGISAKIIRKATIPGTKYRYPRITDKIAAEAEKKAKKAKKAEEHAEEA